MWEPKHGKAIYTHYTCRGASRLDIIYTTRNLRDHKQGIETRVAAFTDHLAVVPRIELEVTTAWRARSYWKMNTTILREKTFQSPARKMGGLDKTDQTLPQHCPMVGTGRQDKTQMDLHRRRNRKKRRRNTDEELLLCLPV